MTAQAINRPSLTRTITLRLAITCFLAIALQLAMVVVRTYLDEDDLNKSYVTRQAQVVLGAIKLRHKGLVFHEARIPAQYSGKYAAFYAFRILTADGQILAERNGGKIREFSPWQDRPSNTQDLWLLDLDTDENSTLSGASGRKLETTMFGSKSQLSEIRPAFTWGSWQLQVLDDVWLPMIPLVVLTLGVATLSVRRSLRSLVQAAAKAEQMSPFDGGDRLDISDMPREAASLAIAINRLLDRVGELVKSQRLFIARAAHELRTPLSVIMLELGRIEDPHMRRLEEDVRTMSRTVARLLTLARLESPETLEMVDLDIGQVADEVVNLLEGWAATTQHQLILKICQPALFTGDANAVREALRNLVENAVRHIRRAPTYTSQLGQRDRSQ